MKREHRLHKFCISVLGGFASGELLERGVSIFHKMGINGVFKQEPGENFFQIPNNYLLNNSIRELEKSDLIFLIGTNPRIDAPLVNLRLRKNVLHDGYIITFGQFIPLLYNSMNLGSRVNNLLSIIEGKH